jgi:hypothetical protein
MHEQTAQQTLTTTRRALHGVAELVLAGPQHAESGDIRLEVLPHGIGCVTTKVRIEGHDLVSGTTRIPLGSTCRELAAAAGLEARAPGIYSDGSGVDLDEPLTIDAESLDVLLQWYRWGDAALQSFAPDAERVLWPEHFDVAITLDEVNYGASPGDAGHQAPYAYVGPWAARTGEFWNAPFGALRPATAFPDVAAVVAFFKAGQSAA